MSEERDRIEAALLGAVQSTDPYLTEIASHLLTAGGKRLRPVIAVAAAQVGVRDPEHGGVSDDVVRGAISCELVHLGSLYHDDVMDEATTRRGVETVNARWGNLQAVVAGDFLLARASEIAASLGNEISGLLAVTIGRLCEGQVEELQRTYDPSRTVESYLSSINGKTASLFAASARIGALAAQQPRDVVETLTKVATEYGMVFQIVDDILDLTSTDSELGKPAGHDIKKGVYTFPVLVALASGGSAAEELRALLGAPLRVEQWLRALEIVRSGPGLASAVDLARGYAANALAAQSSLPDCAATQAICCAPQMLLDSVVLP